jgi:hypothetical protein
VVYRPVPRSEIVDALAHMYALHRQVKPSNWREFLAYERREAATRDLLSNLPRTNEHPTLKTLLEVADLCRLTLEGAHKLFGYDLGEIREHDLRLNGSRTHIFESYSFKRNLLIDLPLRLAPSEAFRADALLRDLVVEWQTDVPIRAIEEKGWEQTGAFYVHVGTEDSLGSSIPPGALALVEPVSREEALRPNPRGIYLLQFGNGYRCSHCVVTRGKLRLFSSSRAYLGREEFAYPAAVRIAGRIRMFAVSLPVPEYPFLRLLPACQPCADLILPWEHRTRAGLLATKHKRFKRSKDEEKFIRDFLKADLNAKLSGRTERRYRGHTSSEPHVNALIHLTIAHGARYTDTLRSGGSWFSDKGQFSLESLLHARRLEDALIVNQIPDRPTPSDVWDDRRREFVEWPPLLSMKFPQLRQWDDRIIRLGETSAVGGLDPAIGPGSWMLIEKIPKVPDTQSDNRKSGWSRPLYVLRRGLQIFCGYVERDGSQYALLSNSSSDGVKIAFRGDELTSLRRVAGVAVPV